jgi:acyl transferase domain-containing protein
MEPQLYKLLEVSWEAWTDSGIDVRSLRDSSRVGVYTGICGSEVPTLHSTLLAPSFFDLDGEGHGAGCQNSVMTFCQGSFEVVTLTVSLAQNFPCSGN